MNNLTTPQNSTLYAFINNNDGSNSRHGIPSKLHQRAVGITDTQTLSPRIYRSDNNLVCYVVGSNDSSYRTAVKPSGWASCNCAFWQGLNPTDQQSVGCKHLIALALVVGG